MHKSTGVLRYSYDATHGAKLIVEVDQGVSDYYRCRIPKWHTVQPQKYAAHMSVVRHEPLINTEHWGKHEGELIEFEYEPFVQVGEVYYWLNVYCDRLIQIRRELGLEDHSEYSRPPDGKHCFHITIANCKIFNGII